MITATIGSARLVYFAVVMRRILPSALSTQAGWFLHALMAYDGCRLSPRIASPSEALSPAGWKMILDFDWRRAFGGARDWPCFYKRGHFFQPSLDIQGVFIGLRERSPRRLMRAMRMLDFLSWGQELELWGDAHNSGDFISKLPHRHRLVTTDIEDLVPSRLDCWGAGDRPGD
jgi:hypothetical protein